MNELERFIYGYSKGTCYYSNLKNLTSNACNNAVALRKRDLTHWDQWKNPSTGVYQLVNKVVELFEKK